MSPEDQMRPDDDATPDPIVHRRRNDGLPPWVLKWVPALIAFVLGLFTMGVATTEWGDRRYVRRDEFLGHEKLQQEFQNHETADKRMFATKDELLAALTELRAHTLAGSHPGTAADLTAIRVSLAQLSADVSWLKEQERRRAAR